MADIQNLDEYKVTIKDTSYNLLQVPAPGTPIVEAQKARMLDGLKLDEVVKHRKEGAT